MTSPARLSLTTNGLCRLSKASDPRCGLERIREDERHADVTIAEVVEIQQRPFTNWWMGVATRDNRTAHVFEPYLRRGRLDPRSMKAAEMLSLMKALSRIGLAREPADTQLA